MEGDRPLPLAMSGDLSGFDPTAGAVLTVDVDHPWNMTSDGMLLDVSERSDDHDIAFRALQRGSSIETDFARAGGCRDCISLEPLAVVDIPNVDHLEFVDPGRIEQV